MQVELATCIQPDHSLKYTIQKNLLQFNPESYDPRPAPDLRLELHPDLRPNLLPKRLHPCHCRRPWPGHTLKHHNYGALERKVYEKLYVCSPVVGP